MDLYTVRSQLNMGIALTSMKLRVTDYSRVSTDHLEQQKSLKNQIEHFDEMIKKDLDKFMDDIRKQVNNTMKETFDNSTKSMLSNAVLSILGANETYRQIENNIKCIADKQV